MSLLLTQPSKLSFRRPVFVRSSHHLCNGFTYSLPQSRPCVFICPDPSGSDRGKLVTIVPGGYLKEKKKKEDKWLKELYQEMGTIGSSNGWLSTLKDGVLRLRDTDLDVDRDPKRMSLPPLVTLPHCQTQIVTNVVLSSSSPEDDGCVVAVKFLGPQLSFCRLGQINSEWINMRIKNPCFFSSPVMYSKKDDMFRILGSGGHLLGSWDLHKRSKNPKLQSLRFQNLPKLSKTQRDILDSCSTSEYLVESITTSETFMVKSYKKTVKIVEGIARIKTKAIMVFKVDDDGNAVYTEDIGDQSIILTPSETFCVLSRSSLCHRRPNLVKILNLHESMSTWVITSGIGRGVVPYNRPPPDICGFESV